ncbi:hypothetical protein T11_18059 [Trichinella zimbabwensis]|uniref:Uncharacterized protein n=1 Tax=Trichinella zimbabwensis TaxID=268475 RepID=A0A0V1HTE0_9BILA|nr:hypothetical protein T11_18059 [Trichinella zimbabwensis]
MVLVGNFDNELPSANQCPSLWVGVYFPLIANCTSLLKRQFASDYNFYRYVNLLQDTANGIYKYDDHHTSAENQQF